MYEKTNCLYEDEALLAQRELMAFTAAVKESFGEKQAMLAAEDWLDEFGMVDGSPRSITIAASARLATRLNIERYSLPIDGQPSRISMLDYFALNSSVA